MWDFGSGSSSYWSMEGLRSPPMGSSSHNFTDEIHVLLVDHDKESLASTARILELYSYKVTSVQSGFAAFSMLSDGKEQFDLLLTDIRLPDIDGSTLLQLAINRELPTILMSADEDAMVAKIALENGACFFLEKPVGATLLKNLWQCVIRERLFRVKILEKKESLHGTRNLIGELSESKGKNTKEKNEITNTNSKNGPKRKARDGKGINVDEVGECKKGKRKLDNKKAFTEWTEELHEKFMAAVNFLGEGRCYPKEILELMNVPSLSRMQVASHLQKCRNDKWRCSSRKTNSSSAPNNSSQYTIGSRRFGSMPRFVKSSSYPQTSHLQETHEKNTVPEIYSSLGDTFMGNRQGKQHKVQVIHSQDQMVQNYFGSNHLTHNSGIQCMGQLGSNVIGNIESFVTATSRDVGGQNFDNHLEINSNQNSEMVLPFFQNATFGTACHSSSSSQNQVIDDFFDLLPELEQSQGFSKLVGGSSVVDDNISIPEHNILDVEPIFFNKHQRSLTLVAKAQGDEH